MHSTNEELGQRLLKQNRITEETLRRVFQILEGGGEKGLEEILVQEGFVGAEELEEALLTFRDASEKRLREKIETRTARVGVLGMGYVGLPLMVAVAEVGFQVTGIDIAEDKVESINAGRSYVEDVSDAQLSPFVESRKITATTHYSAVRDLDVIIICVPTPLNRNKEPNLRPIEQTVQGLSEHMAKVQLIICQSTTFPGTTQEVILPRLQYEHRRVGRDFYLAFSPERTDPGNKEYGVRNIPKVVGGITERCTKMAVTFFEQFVDHVVPVSSARIAEMTKLLENIFRNVNIAFVNELMMLCDRMDIDIWEVIEAASTKPFGFMPFYPGPGVGGHCICVDPFYLSWKAREYDFYVNFIELAAETNDNMPYYVVDKITRALNERGKPLSHSKLLLLGLSFKRNVSDIRNSPALKIAELLQERGAMIAYNDDHVPEVAIGGETFRSLPLERCLFRDYDVTVILVDHDYYPVEQILQASNLVIDIRNVTKGLKASNVVKI